MTGKKIEPGAKRFFWVHHETWGVLSNFVTAFGIFGTIVGAIWGVTQYYASQEADRQKYTLELVNNWEEQGYQASYSKLRIAYEDFIKNVPTEQQNLAKTYTFAEKNVSRAFNKEIAESPQESEDVRRVVLYFNRLNLCLEANLCTQKIAATFFDDTVKSFVETFQPYIDDKGDDLPGGKLSVARLSARLNP